MAEVNGESVDLKVHIMQERSAFVQKLLDDLDLVELIGKDCSLSETLRGHWVGWHSIHESQSKQSLHVYADQSPQNWYCYHCHEGGTAIDYIMSARGLSTGEAIDCLGEECAFECPEWTPEQRAKWERRRKERQIIETILMEDVEYCHNRLTAARREYLHRRGLTDETINKFKLGHADGMLYRALTANTRSHSDEELLLSGLFVQFKNDAPKDLFEHRYVFPYLHRDRPCYIIGRIDPEAGKVPKWNEAKYKN